MFKPGQSDFYSRTNALHDYQDTSKQKLEAAMASVAEMRRISHEIHQAEPSLNRLA